MRQKPVGWTLSYLVGGLEHVLFFHNIWDVILPIDFHMFQDGHIAPPSRIFLGDHWCVSRPSTEFTSCSLKMWVCLKMLCTPKPNGFADHYPYEKWLFHWEYTLFSDIPMLPELFFVVLVKSGMILEWFCSFGGVIFFEPAVDTVQLGVLL